MSQFQVNQAYYFAANPDVFQAWAAGDIPSAEFHYNNYGWVEMRDPNEYFDTSYYLMQNPDAAAAIHAGDFASPLQHFVLYGAAEGRAPRANAATAVSNFDEDTYLTANPDVAAAVAAGEFENGMQHWQLYGQFEARPGAPATPGVPGDTFTLTTGTDIETGGAGDDVFQADVVQTGLLPNQTLTSGDNLDGGEGWNTLNAQLVDPNVTPAGLSNIQEINISSAPGVAAGLINLIAAPRLNAINADSVEVLGFSALYNDVAIDNLDAGLTDINISNSGPWLIGGSPDININLIGDNLGGEEDALNINLVNAGVILDVDYDGSAEDQGYEIVNIDSSGSAAGAENILSLEGTALAARTVNVTGGTDLDMSGSTALDLDNLRTFTAAALTASLVADFVGAAENEDGELQTVEIIGAEGDNDLSFNGTAGNLVIETFDGDDEISVLGHEGDIDLSTGAGDDEVTLNAARFGPDATGEGITIDMGEGDNTLEVLIPSLSDDQQDALVDGDVALMSFGDADIQNVQTLVVDGDLKANAAGLGPVGTIVIDLAGLADIETVEFDDEVLVGGADFIIANAPDELTLTFKDDLRVGASGSLNNEDTEDLTINAEVGATIAGTLDFEDVEDLTLNIGNANASGQQIFNIQPSAVFLGDDLETLTVNLIDGSGDTDGANFVGPVTLTSSAQSLETVVVTGSENSDFTMSFHEDVTPELTTIDLSDFDGQADVSVFDGTGYAADAITIIIGGGDVDYDQGVADQRETFVFTDGDFGLVEIADFQTDNAADAASSDRIDLTDLGITSLGQLDIDGNVGGPGLVTIESDFFEGTIEVNVLGDTADFTDYLIF